MRNLHTPMAVISELHSNSDSLFAACASRKLEEVTGKSIQLHTLNSGDTTMFTCEDGVGDATYVYQFDPNETLSGVLIQSDEYPILEAGVLIEVDDEMIQLYRTVIAASHVLHDLTRNNGLSDQELHYYENWHDSI